MPHSFKRPNDSRRPRAILHWPGRILDNLAIIMITVPLGMALIAASDGLPRIRGACGNTTENEVLALGLFYFAVKFGWKVLKSVNDFIDPLLPNHSPEPKPQPLDDL